MTYTTNSTVASSWGQHYVLLQGKTTWKTDPCGIALAAVIRPPCDWTIDRQIDSPIPMPSVLVVKKGLEDPLFVLRLDTCSGILYDMRTQS